MAGSRAGVSGAGVFGAWADGVAVAVGVATGVEPAQPASAAKAKKRPTTRMEMLEGLRLLVSILAGADDGPSISWEAYGEIPGPC